MTQILYSIAGLKKLLKKENPSGVFLVTSHALEKKLHGVIAQIGVPKNNVIFIPDGEKAKEWGELEKLLESFTTRKVDRKSIVIALGGGTVGDVVGFAASMYLRGIAYVQIPTTLVAQADSAHGGKTGINFHGYKNQIGSTYAPLAVVVDTRLLRSLSEKQVIDGLGEIIKAGLIKDPSILSLLKNETIATLLTSPRLPAILKKAVAVKQFYTAKDPREENIRKILNAGHTVGHAIELKYTLPHGAAVLVGLSKELMICESLGLTPPSVRKDFETLLKQLGITLDQHLSADWASILHDKKVAKNTITLPVITAIGKSKLVEISLTSLQKALRRL